jgi:long-chain acyl-CoA synthetase
MAQRTLPQLLEDSVRAFPNNVILWEKTGPKYEGLTYAGLRERVHAFGAGLVALGFKPGDRAALISEGRNDWVVSELGILCAGGINVPVSVKVEELSDLKFRLSHSGCRLAIVSRAQLPKLRRVKKDLPDLERTVVLGAADGLDRDETSADDVRAKGSEYLRAHPAEFEALWRSVKESDPANICYTSGTTADPKGIVLTHRNYTANIEQSLTLVQMRPDQVLFLISRRPATCP